MGVMAGLTNAFTPDLKYAFTSDNMLNLLNAIEEMTKAGYMPNYAIEAGQRMVMCQQGKTMIFGKAMPLFENNINKNNAALEANDGTAVENSIPLSYVFLPMPTMDGVTESCFGTVDAPVSVSPPLTPRCCSTLSARPAAMLTSAPRALTRATPHVQRVRSVSSLLLLPVFPLSRQLTPRLSWTRS